VRHRRPHVLGLNFLSKRRIFRPAVQVTVGLLIAHARMRALVIDRERMNFCMRGTKKLGYLGSLL
jgi:hypothetical protein